MTPTNPIELFTPFLPTTYDFPKEESEHDRFILEHFTQIADVTNDKKIGSYVYAAENFNGNKFQYKTVLRKSTKHVRNGYQAITYFPSLVSGTYTALTTPQYPLVNVNNQLVITMLYGTASRPPTAVGANDGDYFSYFSQSDPRITFTFSDTTIVITTTTDLSMYSGFIVCEFLRDGT
jgi:hypothetical protein